MIEPLREIALSVDDYYAIICNSYELRDLIDNELIGELYDELIEYANEASVQTLLIADYEEDYYSLSKEEPDIYKQLMEVIGQKMLDLDAKDDFGIDERHDRLEGLASEIKEELLEKMKSELTEEDLEESSIIEYLRDEDAEDSDEDEDW